MGVPSLVRAKSSLPPEGPGFDDGVVTITENSNLDSERDIIAVPEGSRLWVTRIDRCARDMKTSVPRLISGPFCLKARAVGE